MFFFLWCNLIKRNRNLEALRTATSEVVPFPGQKKLGTHAVGMITQLIIFADGVGTPDPNPIHLVKLVISCIYFSYNSVNWCSKHCLVHFASSKLAIRGSSWGPGFRIVIIIMIIIIDIIYLSIYLSISLSLSIYIYLYIYIYIYIYIVSGQATLANVSKHRIFPSPYICLYIYMYMYMYV